MGKSGQELRAGTEAETMEGILTYLVVVGNAVYLCVYLFGLACGKLKIKLIKTIEP